MEKNININCVMQINPNDISEEDESQWDAILSEMLRNEEL